MRLLVILCGLTVSMQCLAEILPLTPAIIADMHAKKTYHPGCPVPPERLREVRFDYYDFAGKEHHDGSIIVMDSVAYDAEQVFINLHAKHFPIQQARRIEYYGGNDKASMRANNTSAFNCRAITGASSGFSMHAYGVAIDINPKQNPYVAIDSSKGQATITPAAGWHYLNRDNQEAGMAESIVDVFKQHGFTIWGGHWHTPIDWQHFQPSRACAQLLADMSHEDAQLFFAWYKADPTFLNSLSSKDQSLLAYYRKDAKKFMAIYSKHHEMLNKAKPEIALAEFERWWSTALNV